MKQILLFTLLLSLVICAIKINIKNEQKQLIKQTLNLFDKKYPNLRTLMSWGLMEEINLNQKVGFYLNLCL